MADPHKGGTCPDGGAPGFMPVHDDGDGLQTVTCPRDGAWVQEVIATGDAVLYSDGSAPQRELPETGARVRITGIMQDDPAPLDIGDTGTVTGTNAAEQIYVDWDSGRALILLRGDPFEVIDA